MNYKNVFRFYLQICNRTLKMLSNLLLIKCLARLQMLGFICNHLQPSATICNHLQPRVTSSFYGLQMSRYLQSYTGRGDASSPIYG